MASLLLGPGLLDWLAHREHGTDAGRIHFPDAPQKHMSENTARRATVPPAWAQRSHRIGRPRSDAEG